MNYNNAQNLAQILTDKSLKVLNVPTDVYVKILNFKLDMKAYFEKIGLLDAEIMKDYNVTADPMGQFVYPEDGSVKPNDFVAKIIEARKALDWTPKESNFITPADFVKFTGQLDFDSSSVIAEALLKLPEEKSEMKLSKKVKNG